jgi:hypothetical protein
VGLHAELGQDGQVDCEVDLSRHPKQRVSLNRQRPSFRLDQDMRAGGLLMFVFRGKPVWNNPANNIVLGEPRLVKS